MSLKEEFIRKFGNQPMVVQAPGRINLIGEHTDYNDGLVLPCAIQYHLNIAMALNGSNNFRCFSSEYGEVEFSSNQLERGGGWINYVMGVVDGFHSRGIKIPGFDLGVEGNLPVGAGLSSSAALCCGIAFALNESLRLGLETMTLARIAQHAEHHFAGVRCGIMDQFACLFGKKNTAILLDCRTLDYERIEMNLGSYSLLLVNSGVHHQLASSEYNRRRESCEEGVRELSKSFEVSSLRDVTAEMLNDSAVRMDPEVLLRCRFVIEEIKRTKKAAGLLRANELEAFGACMFETHQGLRYQYEVSCPETDFLVDLARDFKGVAGARMMGGGFGGCTLNLIQKDLIEEFSSLVRKKYVASFKKEPDFYQVSAGDGVRISE